MAFKLDMSMMFVMHDALRRELERIARVTAPGGDDPRTIFRTAVGWELFKSYLHAHHRAEDETLWPVMAGLLEGRPGDLALLDAMEAEHARIDPLLDSIDAALADHESGPARLGELADTLHAELTGHLAHEETEALPLIDDVFDEQKWSRLGARQRERIGGDVPRYLPWLLDDLEPERVAAILGGMPAEIRTAYDKEWSVAYGRLILWPGIPGK
ncbi:hemerythrin domain-containing protein [Spongiactinospora sp. TRM90649]|uniref:hemerythrin domain-containing protein n=1 Tax=Spongiactinospora sp. TRM90649 TaxID=3031114 RepID=UPI0023F8223A|nr:hemerythrin domain-containing protein [Spongiactinospora sp. TRM90649]MDF5753630.1 hemerythrin domain-containing protein [Spongiactinospora sp. TRM90649]